MNDIAKQNNVKFTNFHSHSLIYVMVINDLTTFYLTVKHILGMMLFLTQTKLLINELLEFVFVNKMIKKCF